MIKTFLLIGAACSAVAAGALWYTGKSDIAFVSAVVGCVLFFLRERTDVRARGRGAAGGGDDPADDGGR